MSTDIAQAVIDAFGGLTLTARALDIPISTVNSWKRKGAIPDWRMDAIIAAAQGANVELPADFFRTPEPVETV